MYAGGNALLLWKDSGPVYSASNEYDASPIVTLQRWDSMKEAKISLRIPHAVQAYNTHRRGVNLLESSEKAYRIRIERKVWYWCIYTWWLNVSITMAWRL